VRAIGLIRAAAHAPRHDLTPRLRARLAESRDDEPVRLELPAFSWPWRFAAGVALALPFVVPDPVRFLAASGLL